MIRASAVAWRWPWWGGPGPLRLLILAVSDRCDQKCTHCQIWMGAGQTGPALTLAERLRVVEEALLGGITEALLTGGEPLLSRDLWPVAEKLAQGGARLMLATNGSLLARFAEPVARLFDEVYVSLDGGDPVTHDGVRGAEAWTRLQAGIAALRRLDPSLWLVARCTLHAGNAGRLPSVVAGARALGFSRVSFLPLDASSEAFGGDPGARRSLVPSPAQVEELEHAIDRLERDHAFSDGFVLEDPGKLRRIARHLQASGGGARFERPACDAPWWSSVVEADGRLRPCFFHPAVGDVREGLEGVRGSESYRRGLDIVRGANPVCERCVCPKRRSASLLDRVRAS